MKTILQAITDEISYPIGKGLIENKIISRGLDGEEEFTIDVAKTNEYKGAIADCLYALIDAPNFSEADIHISLADRDMILRKANAIYAAIGESTFDEPMVYIL